MPGAPAIRCRARGRWRAARAVITVSNIKKRLAQAAALDNASNRDGHGRYLRTLQLGVRFGGAAENSITDLRVEHAAAEASQLMRQGTVVVSIGSEGDRDNSHWTQQGDAALATREVLAARFKLRHEPEVAACLHAFWTAAVRGGGGFASAALFSSSLLDATLQFDAYYALFSRVYAVLLDDYNLTDVAESIRDDFLGDAKGDETITVSELGDSLFELSDMWVNGVDAAACKEEWRDAEHRSAYAYASRIRVRTTPSRARVLTSPKLDSRQPCTRRRDLLVAALPRRVR